jgi:LDH2 family malate/lactate/ureidoglycolate dehydrogenase
MSVFRPESLREIAKRILAGAGTPESNAEIVADHLVRAHLYGHDSHGVIRLRSYVRRIREGTLKPDAHITVMKETQSVAVVDGNLGFGQVVGREAMLLAIKKAKSTGVGFVSMARMGHMGRIGEFTEIAAENGCIGVTVVADSLLSQAPWGSIDPILGTNPVSICVPAGKHRSVLLDAATSMVAGGKISMASAIRKPIPEGWVIDSEGNPTTNPDDFRPPLAKWGAVTDRRGALLPFGSYKGSALALIVEILGGSLAAEGVSDDIVKAGSIPGKAKRRAAGAICVAIDIKIFKDLDMFRHSVDNLIELVKRSRRARGVTEYVFDKESGYIVDPERLNHVDEILIAGDKEYKNEVLRRKAGIYIDRETLETIREDARGLKIDISGLLQ